MPTADLGDVLDDIVIIEIKNQRYMKVSDLEVVCNLLADIKCTNTNVVLKQIVEKLKNTQ